MTPTFQAREAPKSRRGLMVAGIAVAALLLVGGGVAAGAALVGRPDDTSAAESSPPKERLANAESSAGPAAPPAPESPTEPSAPVVIPLGSPLESKNFHLTVRSAEVVDQIETTDGAPLTPDPGTQLVLVKTVYSVTGPNAVDLTCGNYDAFIRGYDSEGGQMAEVFETPRIPGNQPCNQKIVTGQTAEWNFAYQMAQGRQPAGLVVIDTSFYGADAWGEEQLMALR